MALLRNIISVIILFACLAACSDHYNGITSAFTDEEKADAYLRLMISVPSATRANPTGGENGDGLEVGIYHENDIEDIMLFFYRDVTGKGVDNDASTEILHSEYIDGSGLSVSDTENAVTATFPLFGYTPAEGDRVVVVANMGNLSSIKTLGELRDYLVADPWLHADKIADYTRFTMATAKNNAEEGRIHVLEREGTKENPFFATAQIERTAARVDFMLPSSASASDNAFVYATSFGNVRITHILPVNFMQQPTYLLKRVTKDVEDFGSLLVCGDETIDADARPTNYVVEPHTLAKPAATDFDLNAWYGALSAANIRNNYVNLFNENYEASAYFSRSEVQTNSDGRFLILGYTNENTQPMDLYDSKYLSGLVFRAVLQPNILTKNSDGLWKSGLSGSIGQTVWACRFTGEKSGVLFFYSEAEAIEYVAETYPGEHTELTCYEGGVCYYNLWLRHANLETANPHETIPMEYGIVRNNIYQVAVSFSGPGTPTPEVREPQEIQSRIYVRKWNFRLHPVITF